MTTAYVLSTLINKRAEFAVTIAELKRQFTQHNRAELAHVDFLLLPLMQASIPERL